MKRSHSLFKVWCSLLFLGVSVGVALPAAAKTKNLPTQTKAVQVEAKIQKPPTGSPSFDPVPADQTEALLKRLKLVETLIEKFGRAYDYRALTVSQLENILANLEKAEPPVGDAGKSSI